MLSVSGARIPARAWYARPLSESSTVDEKLAKGVTS